MKTPHSASSASCCQDCHRFHGDDISRRLFLGRVGGVVAGGIMANLGGWPLKAAPAGLVAGTSLPVGRPLRVHPILVFHLDQRREKTSWRSYGGLRTPEDVEKEHVKIEAELQQLRAKAEFPLEILPLSRINNEETARKAAKSTADILLVYGASGAQNWLEILAASGKPNLLFVRHKSGPVYLWYEIAHWRLLRKSEDQKAESNLDFADVVVDSYDDIQWRLRALYGLGNAKNTRMLAIGGMAAYSRPGQERGPVFAKEVWGYDFVQIPFAAVSKYMEEARQDIQMVNEAKRLTEELLTMPNVHLDTDRKFIINTFLATQVFRKLMQEKQAANLGVADCMTGLIPILDTPPCLVLSLLNDEGLTAFCHTDLTHTIPGVLMRWISGKPSFVCNSHFPHHGVLTLAHCAAPRKMNGRDFEPTTLMTHYESDYGAATKVHYPKGQVVTCVIPNLNCTKWFGFRGRIIDSPSFDMCRSQMDIEIDGDWRALTREMEGFHTIVCYGDYLREMEYACRKAGSLEWKCYSTTGA